MDSNLPIVPNQNSIVAVILDANKSQLPADKSSTNGLFKYPSASTSERQTTLTPLSLRYSNWPFSRVFKFFNENFQLNTTSNTFGNWVGITLHLWNVRISQCPEECNHVKMGILRNWIPCFFTVVFSFHCHLSRLTFKHAQHNITVAFIWTNNKTHRS